MNKQATDFDAEYDRVMNEHYRSQARHEYWFGLLNVLKQWARCEEDCSLNRLDRIFYTLKAVFCMLTRRQQSYWQKVYITVAIFDTVHVGSCGGAYPDWATSWNEVVVGVGVFRNWWYDICNNSNC